VTGLERLLGIEVAAAQTRRHTGLLRFASLPAPYRIDDFDFAAQPGVEDKLIRELASLRFLNDAGNVLLSCWGQPGTGKTMIAIGLARAAIEAGHRVYFTTPPTWPNAANAPLWKDDGRPRCGFLRPTTARHRRVRLRPTQPRSGSQHGAVRGDQPPLLEVLDHPHQPHRRRLVG
jgi:hypothetical protein